MRLFKIAIVIVIALCLNGCATAVKYSFDKNLYRRNTPMDYSVVVDVLEDTRPQAEHDGTVYNKKDFSCTKDKGFKPYIDLQISQMLVAHLNEARLFNSVELRDIENNLHENSEEMEKLRQQDIDLAITGNIKHFYGFQSNPVAVGAVFGLVGVLAEAMANPKTVGAEVEYGDIRVIDINENSVLWTGDIEYGFEKEDIFYDGPRAYVLQGLKSANEKAVYTLENILTK
jgi:curli biogenesis system outer membrane secretion channel CsgG